MKSQGFMALTLPVGVLLCGLSGIVFGQGQSVPAPASAPQAAAAQELTELDKAELQIVALQDTVRRLTDQLNDARAQVGQCYAQLGPLVAKANESALPKLHEDALARIEARHPGFILNRQTGLLEPKPATEAPAPAGIRK